MPAIRTLATARAALAATVVAVTSLAAAPAFAQADSWPNKPVRMIVNFPPGGAADVMARLISQPVSEALGQPIVIENRAGANGNIGGDVVAKADADGYTFLFSSGGMASVNPHIYANMPFNPEKDLTPVAAAARVLVYLVTKPDGPGKDVRSFIKYAQDNPGKLSYATPGNGSSPHLAAEMLNAATGIESVHVPYRGAAPAVVDLLAGQVDYMFDPGVGLQHVKDGKLRLLAVGSLERSPMFPDAPTLAEVGIDGFNADTVFGIYAPAGTDPKIIERLNTEVNRALAQPAIQQRIADIGGVPTPMSPQAFAQQTKDDSERFGKLVRDRNIKAN